MDRSSVPARGKRTEIAVVLTLAWLTLVGIQVAELFGGGERVLLFKEPALVAARSFERPYEVVAALPHLVKATDAAKLPKGDGPLGLEKRSLWLVSEQLLAVAQELVDTAARLPVEEQESDGAHLRREAAKLAARALIVGASIDRDASRLGRGAASVDEVVNDDAEESSAGHAGTRVDALAMLALDPVLAARTTELLRRSADADAGPILQSDLPSSIDGLPALLLLERAGTLPPADEWAASRALVRVLPLAAVVFLLALPMLVGLCLLLFTRRLISPATPIVGRMAMPSGWIGFTAGQISFALIGTVMVLAGVGGITGGTVALSSVGIALAALWAADLRPGGDVGAALERLGLTGSLRTAPGTLIAGLSAVPLMGLGVFALSGLTASAASLWSNPYLGLVLTGGMDTWHKMALEAGVWAPMFEELAFRGVLFAALRSRLRFGPAALASSAIFAAAHPYDLSGMLTIMWVGFVLCWLYERSGSLVACMAAHSAFNLIQLSMMLLLL